MATKKTHIVGGVATRSAGHSKKAESHYAAATKVIHRVKNEQAPRTVKRSS